METIVLPHLPSHRLQVALFADVQNAAFLRQQLLEGNTEFEYAFLDASAILSRTHVLAACFRAINDVVHNRLKSRNVHSEIVFSLSPNNNIAESFRRFGIADGSRNVLAIKVNADADSVFQHLKLHVEGTTVPFADSALAEMCDPVKIRKYYRLEAPKKGDLHPALGNEVEAFVLGSMALKGS